MKEGSKPIIFHTIHTAIVFISMVISIVFGPCFGFDNADEYTCIYHHGEYTFLSYFYGIPVLFFIILLVIFGSFHSVPYGVMYWIKYWLNTGLDNAKKGMALTAVAFLLIIIHPFGPICLSDMSDRYIEWFSEFIWFVIFLSIIVAAYLMPYSFIRLSYPQLLHIHIYKVYSVFLASQLIIYLLLIAYSMTPLPEALSEYMDRKYLYWYHWY